MFNFAASLFAEMKVLVSTLCHAVSRSDTKSTNNSPSLQPLPKLLLLHVQIKDQDVFSPRFGSQAALYHLVENRQCVTFFLNQVNEYIFGTHPY